jgi:hypothetical protein
MASTRLPWDDLWICRSLDEPLSRIPLPLIRFHSDLDDLLINLPTNPSSIQEPHPAKRSTVAFLPARRRTEQSIFAYRHQLLASIETNPVNSSLSKVNLHVFGTSKRSVKHRQRFVVSSYFQLASYDLRISLRFRCALSGLVPGLFASKSRGVLSDARDPTSHDGRWGCC